MIVDLLQDKLQQPSSGCRPEAGGSACFGTEERRDTAAVCSPDHQLGSGGFLASCTGVIASRAPL